MLDQAALGQGEIVEAGAFAAGGATFAAPLGDAIVVADASGATIVDADGEHVLPAVAGAR